MSLHVSVIALSIEAPQHSRHGRYIRELLGVCSRIQCYDLGEGYRKVGVRKVDLMAQIAAKQGIPMPVARVAVQAFLDSFVDALSTEGRVELRDFGIFRVRDCVPRIGRNPKTGEAVQIPERRAVSFKMGRIMRKRINGE